MPRQVRNSTQRSFVFLPFVTYSAELLHAHSHVAAPSYLGMEPPFPPPYSTLPPPQPPPSYPQTPAPTSKVTAPLLPIAAPAVPDANRASHENLFAAELGRIADWDDDDEKAGAKCGSKGWCHCSGCCTKRGWKECCGACCVACGAIAELCAPVCAVLELCGQCLLLCTICVD
ncbi:hypothetical protein M427DRAFT_60274 [Gonapodya prolifera JEL478]|uniref:Uncharacterized protein n=1 Tax=Gonapodya prolifera (strain JEL478) TaxID=1344416 RepID=A0A139A5C7_GONPJ|nr:hypothetical protein M427DRAFT_60274 [Gonapodya prolifera JEL478]|eukprot:KXS11839.1 hypothetical protein M427DRAFT_60274 [Gonapodya prolifera JEL478]